MKMHVKRYYDRIQLVRFVDPYNRLINTHTAGGVNRVWMSCENLLYVVNKTKTNRTSGFKLKFHRTDTDTDILADLSADFNSLEDVRWGCARVYVQTCSIHDKLSCTRLQNYTIGASLKSVSISVSIP